MDCERFDRTTMDLLYGELDELSEAAAMRHLHHCTRCRDIWGHLRTTKDLAALPQEPPPDGLFTDILAAEQSAHRDLPARERFSRAISVLAGYAMRPQLAMAALLLLMIGSSLVFVRATPRPGEHVSVTERGVPFNEPTVTRKAAEAPLVYEGEVDAPVVEASKAASVRTTEDSGEGKGEPAPTEQHTRRTYNDAMLAYQEGRYAEAERLFSEVASSGSEQSASAALHEGHAARNGSGCQRAAGLYDGVAANHAGGTVADEALWHAASCYRAMGQDARARAHYHALLERPAFASRARSALEEVEASPAEARGSSAELRVGGVTTAPAAAGSAVPAGQAAPENTSPEEFSPKTNATSAPAPPPNTSTQTDP